MPNDFIIPELMLAQCNGRLTVVDVTATPGDFPPPGSGTPSYAPLSDSADAVRRQLDSMNSFITTLVLLGWQAEYIDFFPPNEPVPFRQRIELDASTITSSGGQTSWHVPVSRTRLSAASPSRWYVHAAKHHRLKLEHAISNIDLDIDPGSPSDVWDQHVDLLLTPLAAFPSFDNDVPMTGLLGLYGSRRWVTIDQIVDERLVPAFAEVADSLHAALNGATLAERKRFILEEILPASSQIVTPDDDGLEVRRLTLPQRIRALRDMPSGELLPRPRQWTADWVGEFVEAWRADSLANGLDVPEITRHLATSRFKRMSLTLAILHMHNIGIIDVIGSIGFDQHDFETVNDRSERFKLELTASTTVTRTYLVDRLLRRVEIADGGPERWVPAVALQLLGTYFAYGRPGLETALDAIGGSDPAAQALALADGFDSIIARLPDDGMALEMIARIERTAALTPQAGIDAIDAQTARTVLALVQMYAYDPFVELTSPDQNAVPPLAGLWSVMDDLDDRLQGIDEYLGLVVSIDTTNLRTLYRAIQPLEHHQDSREYLLGELLGLPDSVFVDMDGAAASGPLDGSAPPAPLDHLAGPTWTIAFEVWSERQDVAASGVVSSILTGGASLIVGIGTGVLSANPLVGVAAGMATAAVFGAQDYMVALDEYQLATGLEMIGAVNGISLGGAEWTALQRFEVEAALQNAIVSVLVGGASGLVGGVSVGKIARPVLAGVAELALAGLDGLAQAVLNPTLADEQYLTERAELDGYLPGVAPTPTGEIFRSVAMSTLFAGITATAGGAAAALPMRTTNSGEVMLRIDGGSEMNVSNRQMVTIFDDDAGVVVHRWDGPGGPRLTDAEVIQLDLVAVSTANAPPRQPIRQQAIDEAVPQLAHNRPALPPAPHGSIATPAVSGVELTTALEARGTSSSGPIPSGVRAAGWVGRMEAELRFGSEATRVLEGQNHRWQFNRNGDLVLVRTRTTDDNDNIVPRYDYLWDGTELELVAPPPRQDHHSRERRAFRDGILGSLLDPNDPMYPLREIFVDPLTNRFVSREGKRVHYELISFPEIFDAGHIDSYSGGGAAEFIIQSAYRNQAQLAPHEGNGTSLSTQDWIEEYGQRWDIDTARELCLKFRNDTDAYFDEFGLDQATADRLTAALEPLRLQAFPDGLPPP